jgi:hypothetical protein
MEYRVITYNEMLDRKPDFLRCREPDSSSVSTTCKQEAALLCLFVPSKANIPNKKKRIEILGVSNQLVPFAT